MDETAREAAEALRVYHNRGKTLPGGPSTENRVDLGSEGVASSRLDPGELHQLTEQMKALADQERKDREVKEAGRPEPKKRSRFVPDAPTSARD